MDAQELVMELEKIIDGLQNGSETECRSIYYGQLKSCALRVREFGLGHPQRPYLFQKIANLEWSARALAGLETGNEHTPIQHTVWAMSTADMIRDLLLNPTAG